MRKTWNAPFGTGRPEGPDITRSVANNTLRPGKIIRTNLCLAPAPAAVAGEVDEFIMKAT